MLDQTRQSIVRTLVIPVCLLACTWMGCRSHEQPQRQTSLSPTRAVATGEPTVVPIDQVTLQKLITQRNGKILFLNIWATWCVPCVEEFPDLVRLSQAYPESELEVVGISADFPDEIETKNPPVPQEA